jgi:hypothetical protein
LLPAVLAAALSLPARPAAPMASSLGFFEGLASKAAVVSEGFQVYLVDLQVAVELPRHLSEMRQRAQAAQAPSPVPRESACKESRSNKASL